MGELLAAALEVVAILGLDGILNSTGHGIVDTEDGALDKLDLPGGITTQVTLLGSLSLAPGLGGGGLTASVRRGHASGHAKAGSWVLHLVLRVLGHGGSVRRVGLGQTVLGGGPDGRVSSLLGVVEGPAVGTLIEKRARRLVLLWQMVLLKEKTHR